MGNCSRISFSLPSGHREWNEFGPPDPETTPKHTKGKDGGTTKYHLTLVDTCHESALCRHYGRKTTTNFTCLYEPILSIPTIFFLLQVHMGGLHFTHMSLHFDRGCHIIPINSIHVAKCKVSFDPGDLPHMALPILVHIFNYFLISPHGVPFVRPTLASKLVNNKHQPRNIIGHHRSHTFTTTTTTTLWASMDNETVGFYLPATWR